MKTHDFLLELGTEELPPKLLLKLSSALKDNLSSELKKFHIGFDTIKAFATPRRLAITISAIQSKQQEQIIEKERSFNAITRNGNKWLCKVLWD